ncbi:MAG: hypothetical protein RLZZ383_2180 [Pseudomonadota bacterium]
MNRDFLGRGVAFPFAFDPATGGLALSSAEDNIRESMSIILGTRPGERQKMPDFGCRIHELLYTPNTSANASLVAYHVRSALERWEPRIDVVDVKAEATAQGRIAVDVRYRVRSSNQEQVMNLDVSTGG